MTTPRRRSSSRPRRRSTRAGARSTTDLVLGLLGARLGGLLLSLGGVLHGLLLGPAQLRAARDDMLDRGLGVVDDLDEVEVVRRDHARPRDRLPHPVEQATP